MALLKNIRNLLKSNPEVLSLVVLVVVIIIVSQYSKQLGSSYASLTNQNQNQTQNQNDTQDPIPTYPPDTAARLAASKGETSQSSNVVHPSWPLGMRANQGSVNDMSTITSNVQSSCLNNQANPIDLLPKDNNSRWATTNPHGMGELMNVNLLKAGHLTGIDTVAGTLRNANLQLRSEPPNPKTQVSPWSNSTIEPDLMRVPLELGCGSQ